jgi:hypothetical protein
MTAGQRRICDILSRLTVDRRDDPRRLSRRRAADFRLIKDGRA